MDKNEIEALSSIYCLTNEFSTFDNEATFNVLVDVGDSPKEGTTCKVPVKIVLTFSKEYPYSIPDISIFCEHLNREAISTIKDTASQACTNLLGEPMVMSLVSSIQDCLTEQIKRSNESSVPCHAVMSCGDDNRGGESVWTYVLHIDHMRNKTRYCKTLERWAADLSLYGKIVFQHKLILVLLQGWRDDIKEFLVRLKTVNVDVDSRGQSCKEHMMKVLCEHHHDSHQINRFTQFTVCELSCKAEVQTLFEGADLIDIYREHVHGCL